MYIPRHFREDDIATLQELMQANNFAILVTQQPDGVPLASHLPFTLETQEGPYGTLYAHMARANGQWRTFAETKEALVIFQGPHAYVSPSWYQEKLSVPTWNYAVVHAYGKPRIIEDAHEAHKTLATLVEQSEAPFEKPWPLALPDEFMQKMMRGIVPFAIEITRLEGKFKLSQNRPEHDRVHVAEVLLESTDDVSIGVAKLMKQREEKR